MSVLIFIDTNILLDFYRVRSGGVGLSLLTHIDKNHDRIVTSSQIEMEYKKNRQRVIMQSLEVLKTPDWGGLAPPAFLTQARPSQIIESSKKEIKKQSRKLKSRIERVLRNPSRNDPVYQTLQRLFKHKGPCNLTRDKKIRFKIRRQAWKRFMLGYPPRKKEDTFIGDAVNWEWMVHCANESAQDLVIVTRDTDYGAIYNNEPILNDWLSLEFKERVGKKRNLYLTDKLAEGFKYASVRVSKKVAEEEEKLIEEKSVSESPTVDVAEFKRLMDLTRESPASSLREAKEKTAIIRAADVLPGDKKKQ